MRPDPVFNLLVVLAVTILFALCLLSINLTPKSPQMCSYYQTSTGAKYKSRHNADMNLLYYDVFTTSGARQAVPIEGTKVFYDRCDKE